MVALSESVGTGRCPEPLVAGAEQAIHWIVHRKDGGFADGNVGAAVVQKLGECGADTGAATQGLADPNGRAVLESFMAVLWEGKRHRG